MRFLRMMRKAIKPACRCARGGPNTKGAGTDRMGIDRRHSHPSSCGPRAGTDALCRSHPARIIGAAADQHRLPFDLAVSEGDFIEIVSGGEVFDVSGHTLGHIAAYFKSLKFYSQLIV